MATARSRIKVSNTWEIGNVVPSWGEAQKDRKAYSCPSVDVDSVHK